MSEQADFVTPEIYELLPDAGLREILESERAGLEAGGLVRRLRERVGLTQASLADRLHMSQARISQLEHSDGRDGPSYGILRRVAEACEVDLTSLILDALSDGKSS